MDFSQLAGMMGGAGTGMGGMGGLGNLTPEQMEQLKKAQQQAPPYVFYGLPQSVNPPDFKDGNWVCLYPIYIDPTHSSAGGRRMPKHICCENVFALELAEICWTMCKIPCVVEVDKSHPQDSQARNGRVRVKLRKNGTFTNPLYHNKTSILRKCCEVLPILESRKQRIEFQEKQNAQLLERNQKLLAGASEPEKPTSSTSSGSNKKKGKKGKR